jgi:hypothetical protein
MVHRCGYYCRYLKKGDYWQFLKDYWGYDDIVIYILPTYKNNLQRFSIKTRIETKTLTALYNHLLPLFLRDTIMKN